MTIRIVKNGMKRRKVERVKGWLIKGQDGKDISRQTYESFLHTFRFFFLFLFFFVSLFVSFLCFIFCFFPFATNGELSSDSTNTFGYLLTLRTLSVTLFLSDDMIRLSSCFFFSANTERSSSILLILFFFVCRRTTTTMIMITMMIKVQYLFVL